MARRSRSATRVFAYCPASLHALVGRNGAGKSTLVGILTGLREPDSGEIRFHGEPAPAIADREGWRRRVACVYQHSTIIPDLTVAENLFINRQPLRRGFINWGTLWREAREVLDRWDVSVSERSRAGDLKVEARQLVEIARALSYGARFIILDEPTAQLDGEEIKRLFAQMRRLQAQGVTFLFISHHLQEVYEVCQTVTVLRDARHILTAPAATLPKDALIEAMTGEQVSFSFADAANRTAPTEGSVALEVDSLGGEDFDDVSFSVRRRRGHRTLRRDEQRPPRRGRGRGGARAHIRAGTIRINGAPLRAGDVPSALALGVGCVPKSRHRQGLVLTQSVADNVTMPIANALGPLGFIAPARRAAVGEARRSRRSASSRKGRTSWSPTSPAAISRRS